MTLPDVASGRFTQEKGFHIVLQVPETHVQIVIDAILDVAVLKQGDDDSVAFISISGLQQFRCLVTVRNPNSPGLINVPCLEVSFFLENEPAMITQVIEAIYDAHPYEEPVIRIQEALRTKHIPGVDEDNPNRIWNARDADWYKPDG